jgi:hypothetical protein
MLAPLDAPRAQSRFTSWEEIVEKKKIQVTESDQPPICPHCERRLAEISWHKVRGAAMRIGYVAVYSCPHCRKLLAVSASGS